jgi:hypothetical protein
LYTVAIETLGCRLNQAETAILPNFFVLHTCTLTSRRRPRAVIRRHAATVVATGVELSTNHPRGVTT